MQIANSKTKLSENSGCHVFVALANTKMKICRNHQTNLIVFHRQAEYLHQQALTYGNIYGVDQWWIGLTDFGKLMILCS